MRRERRNDDGRVTENDRDLQDFGFSDEDGGARCSVWVVCQLVT